MSMTTEARQSLVGWARETERKLRRRGLLRDGKILRDQPRPGRRRPLLGLPC